MCFAQFDDRITDSYLRVQDGARRRRALEEVAYLAYSSIADVIDEVGQIKPVKEWPRRILAAASSVKVMKRNMEAGGCRRTWLR